MLAEGVANQFERTPGPFERRRIPEELERRVGDRTTSTPGEIGDEFRHDLVAGDEVVPEFVPYLSWRGSRPIANAAFELLGDASSLKRAGRALELVRDSFGEHRPDDEAAESILDVFDGGRGMTRDDWDRDVPSVQAASLSELDGDAEPPPERSHAARARGFSPSAVDLEKRRKS